MKNVNHAHEIIKIAMTTPIKTHTVSFSDAEIKQAQDSFHEFVAFKYSGNSNVSEIDVLEEYLTPFFSWHVKKPNA